MYDYEPASKKDEVIDNAANLIKIAFSILTLDRIVTVGAFPWCESITFLVRSRDEYVKSTLSPVMVSRYVVQEANSGGTRARGAASPTTFSTLSSESGEQWSCGLLISCAG